MSIFDKYPLDHPGWGRLMAGMARTLDKHPPGHGCRVCREYRGEYHRPPENPKPPNQPCANCRRRPARSRQRDAECPPCQKYRRRTGNPRPERLYSKEP